MLLVDDRVDPKDYANLIAAYAQHHIGTSPIAGELFEGLAAFLSREFDRTKPAEVDVIIHTISASSSGGSKTNVASFCAVSDLHKLQKKIVSQA